jgi:hypothetical protein
LFNWLKYIQRAFTWSNISFKFTSNFICFKQEFDRVNTASNKFDAYIKYRKGVALVFRFVFETDGKIKFEATFTDKLDHIMLYWVHLIWAGFEIATLVVIGTDCIGSYKSNYCTITTTMAPIFQIGLTLNKISLYYQ